jgi:type VI secretion system secreted protein Hcp
MADYYLKLDGIDGEGTAKSYESQIVLGSFSWGCSNPSGMGAGAGGGARGGGAKATFSDLSFMKNVDKASNKLFQHCAQGTKIAKATLTCVVTAGDTATERVKVEFEDVLVSSYQSSGSGGGTELPMETGSLTFSKINFTYTEIDAKQKKTPHTAGYDLVKADKV